MPDVRPDKRSLGSGSRLRSFKDLGRYRVNDILLVSTLYDSFILSEDGQLSEVMLDEFLDLVRKGGHEIVQDLDPACVPMRLGEITQSMDHLAN